MDDHQCAYHWRRGRRCESSACVEVAHAGRVVVVRDSKDPAGTVLTFTIAAWQAFLTGVRQGDFDRAS